MEQFWEVVGGGGDKGGILVRTGQPLSSPEAPEHLCKGALVRELEIIGERLHYQLVDGIGPSFGWVSVSLRGKELLRKTSRSAAPDGAEDVLGTSGIDSKPVKQEGSPLGTEEAPLALQVGARVEVRGLKSREELNGKIGKVMEFIESSGRWRVALDDGSVKIGCKPDNLIVLDSKTSEKAADAATAPAARQPLPTGQLTPDETVEWIISAIDEFETLLLPLELVEDLTKIRSQYKKLSKLVHPDKNKHPGANAAFKKLFGATEVLSNPIEQRMALRRARRKAAGEHVVEHNGENWWEQATVDEMEKTFREMENKFEKMGVFDYQKQSGLDDERVWISPTDAKDLLERDLAIFLDSRDVTDFDVSHVRGAHSLPGHTMEQLFSIERTRAFQLVIQNPEQSVIVYSDNGSKMSRCTNVAQTLRQRVRPERVLRLTGGLNAWKRSGFPVDGDARALFAGKVLGNSMMRIGG